MARSRLALSIGCPSGVGPEVAVLAAAARKERILLVGDFGVIARAAELRKVDTVHFVPIDDPRSGFDLPAGLVGVFQPTRSLKLQNARFGAPSKAGGAAQLAWVDAACDLVSDGLADALVTGPVSKEAIVLSRAPGSKGFIGHTEHLQARLRSKHVIMAFYGETFSTALVTTHLALAKVPAAITKRAVETATYWLGDFLLGLAGRKRVKLAVAGLNPHAGEHGLFGKEEIKAISPAIAKVRARFAKERRAIEIVGPVPAETAFRKANDGLYDGVVAMYHDQATIPMKVASFGEAVNVSLALPIVRTSVDHGTAYDIAGKGKADPSGMRAACELAVRMTS
ncbi:MAG TPA: 4-hydroxythreonine-4-phosphate dehydrogenase PdxA [Polyangiaceae bacterium]